MSKEPLEKGDRYIAYPSSRACQRLYITVTRVAKDGSWADINVRTRAVMWTKRMKLTNGAIPDSVRADWDAGDLIDQEVDHMVMLEEREVS